MHSVDEDDELCSVEKKNINNQKVRNISHKYLKTDVQPAAEEAEEV